MMSGLLEINTHSKPKVLRDLCGFDSDDSLKNELIRLHYLPMSMTQIANHFGVARVTIYKYFKKLNLPKHDISKTLDIHQQTIDLTANEIEIINGCLLGDGHLMRRKNSTCLVYVCKHEEVIDDLINKLSRLKPYKRIHKYKRDNRQHYMLYTQSFKSLNEVHEKWYNGKLKVVPDIDLSPATCYWWHLGDGYSSKGRIGLCTHSFSLKEVKLLANKMPCEVKLYSEIRKSTGNTYHFIRMFNIEDRIKFLTYIGPCQHECYQHRFNVYSCSGKILFTP